MTQLLQKLRFADFNCDIHFVMVIFTFFHLAHVTLIKFCDFCVNSFLVLVKAH